MSGRRDGHVVWLGVFAGALLFLIGVRFLVVPDQAAMTFGLAREISGSELHQVVGLRDLWLGGLAIVFAFGKMWRALSLWFLFAVPVCWIDAVIAAHSSGWAWAVGFHIASGVFCLILAWAAWRRIPERGPATPVRC